MYSAALVAAMRGQGSLSLVRCAIVHKGSLDALIAPRATYSCIRQFHLSCRRQIFQEQPVPRLYPRKTGDMTDEEFKKMYPGTHELNESIKGTLEKMEALEDPIPSDDTKALPSGQDGDARALPPGQSTDLTLATENAMLAYPEYSVDITKRRYGASSIPRHEISSFTPVGRKLEQKAWLHFADAALQGGYNKESFAKAVQNFVDQDKQYRRGATEFIYVGLDEMARFGALKDLASYKVLLQAFPPEKMIPETTIQSAFDHFPRQQMCGKVLMEQMQHNGLCPDDDFGIILKNRFGVDTSVVRFYRKIMYWQPKLKNINPYPIPDELPDDEAELAVLALRRMCGYVDKQYQYTVWRTQDHEFLDTLEHTFIASAMSPTQQELLQNHSIEEPLYVEGPFLVYLDKRLLYYFQLRAEPDSVKLQDQRDMESKSDDVENLCEWDNFWESEGSGVSAVRPVLSVHEGDDGTYLALCITGSNSKASLMSWVRLLEESNPNLARVPLLFRVTDLAGGLTEAGENRDYHRSQGMGTD